MFNQLTTFQRGAIQFLFGSIAIAIVALVSLYTQGPLAPTAFACLVAILLFSMMGSVIASMALATVSVVLLSYVLAPRPFGFRIDDHQDAMMVVAFFIASMIGAHVIGRLREEREAARETAATLGRKAMDLHNNEKLWRAVFDHNPAMYFMVDEAGIVLNVNTVGATQLGYMHTELVGLSVLEVFMQDDREVVRKCIRECLASIGESRSWNMRKVRKNNSVLWVRASAKAMLGKDDKPIVLVTCEDITEQKRAEVALQRSEAHLARAQELSHTGSFGWNVATGEVFWSKEQFRIFQYDPETKPTPEHVLHRTHPEDKASVHETLRRAVRGEDFDHEYRLLMPDGSIKYIHALASAIRTASGDVEFVGAATDITAAKQSEQQLRRSEGYLADAQQLSRIGTWSWDCHRRSFAYRSAEVSRLLGFDPDEPVTLEAIRSRIHPDDLAAQQQVQRQAIEQGKGNFEYDFRICLPNGSIRYIHSVARAVSRSDGSVELIGTHMDVTEQRVARQQLESTVIALRESEQRFRDYAETASDWLWETGPEIGRAHV